MCAQQQVCLSGTASAAPGAAHCLSGSGCRPSFSQFSQSFVFFSKDNQLASTLQEQVKGNLFKFLLLPCLFQPSWNLRLAAKSARSAAMPKAAASAALTEDELLDQAIAENKAAADAGVRPLTRTELIAKLDQVMLLHVVATQDGNKQIIPGSDGELCWFSDVFDAKAELTAMHTSMPPPPGISLGLDFCPLGRASLTLTPALTQP